MVEPKKNYGCKTISGRVQLFFLGASQPQLHLRETGLWLYIRWDGGEVRCQLGGLKETTKEQTEVRDGEGKVRKRVSSWSISCGVVQVAKMEVQESSNEVDCDNVNSMLCLK